MIITNVITGIITRSTLKASASDYIIIILIGEVQCQIHNLGVASGSYTCTDVQRRLASLAVSICIVSQSTYMLMPQWCLVELMLGIVVLISSLLWGFTFSVLQSTLDYWLQPSR